MRCETLLVGGAALHVGLPLRGAGGGERGWRREGGGRVAQGLVIHISKLSLLGASHGFAHVASRTFCETTKESVSLNIHCCCGNQCTDGGGWGGGSRWNWVLHS